MNYRCSRGPVAQPSRFLYGTGHPDTAVPGEADVRFAMTVVLWLATTAVLAVAIPAAWAQMNVVDVDGYAAMAQKAARDPVLQSAMASELATCATALIARRGHTDYSLLVHDVASAYTASSSFPPQFAQANKVAHDWLFGDTRQNADSWALDLVPMLDDTAFQQLLNNFNVQVPATATVPLTVDMPKTLRPGRLRPFATWGPWVSIGAAALSAIGAVLTLAAARRRGRAFTSLGVSALLVGASGWTAIEVSRRYVTDALNHTAGDIRQIAEVMVGRAEGSMHQWLNLTLAAGGVLVVFGVLVAMLGSLRQSG
jgi:hypothetical protein